ncbi:MAG: dihydropteroate synthase [Lachnospiraceae bacterium]|nr:dihydropteroate synthase [Lachnospiraceae bacterium]
MKIKNYDLDIEKHCQLMGILNLTPDSFSDGGSYKSVDDALFRVETMIKEGAAIIDVGGESTRPGYTEVSVEEEITRVCPVIERIKSEFSVLVSVDTYKSKVLEAAARAGADISNDIWGFKKDPLIANVAAKYNMACILMHNRENTNYTDFMKDVIADLKESIDIAVNANIPEDNIIIDPGVGFAKSYEQNLEVIRRLDELQILNKPILLATSRKSVIGLTLDLPVDERLEGTLSTTVIGVKNGAKIFRVHDVLANLRAIRMAEAIV